MPNSGIQLRLGDLLFVLQKKWKLIVSLTVVGFIFGLLLSGMNYIQQSVESYRISGSMAITTMTGENSYLGGNGAPTSNDFNISLDLYDSVSYIIKSTRVAEAVLEQLNTLTLKPSDITKNLSVSRHNSTQIISVNLTWPDPEEGLEIWQEVITQSNKLLPQTLKMGRLSIINEPTSKVVSSGGPGKTLWVIMAGLGFAAGAGFAVLELLTHPTLTNLKDVEEVFGLEMLATIPHDSEFFQKKTSILVQNDNVSTEVLQNFSSAAYIIRNRLGIKEPHHSFYVTSATPREGRTTTAAYLAIQLSDMERHTLLVDFDIRNPSLGNLFLKEVDYNRSINALYRSEVTEADAIITLTGYLDLLPMVLERDPISMDSTIIELFGNLTQKYEYVIIDAPPVGKEADTLSLNQVVDSVLFVAAYDNASIPEIQSALDKLDKTGIRVLGCIVNDTHSVTQFSLLKEEKKAKTIKEKKEKEKKKKRREKVKKQAASSESDDQMLALLQKKAEQGVSVKEDMIVDEGVLHEESAPAAEDEKHEGTEPVESGSDALLEVFPEVIHEAPAEQEAIPAQMEQTAPESAEPPRKKGLFHRGGKEKPKREKKEAKSQPKEKKQPAATAKKKNRTAAMDDVTVIPARSSQKNLFEDLLSDEEKRLSDQDIFNELMGGDADTGLDSSDQDSDYDLPLVPRRKKKE